MICRTTPCRALGAALAAALSLTTVVEPLRAAAPAVREMAIDPATGVLSASLGNGVRAHHVALSFRKGQVAVSLTFAQGRLDEDISAPWRLDAAAQGLVESLRRRLPPAEPPTEPQRQPLEQEGFVVLGWVEPDATMFELLGPAEQAPQALALLVEELLEPTLTAADLARAVEQRQQRRDRAAFWALWRAIPEALYPPSHAAALRRPGPQELASVGADAARAALQALARQAPLEVAIAGDLPRAAALEAVAQTLGRLPSRPWPAEAAPGRLRRLTLVAPTTLRAPSASEEALVWTSLATAEQVERVSDAALDAAATLLGLAAQRALSAQLGQEVRVRAYHRSLEPPFGQGSLSLYASVPPASAAQAANLLAEVYGAVAGESPIDEETFRAALARRVEERRQSLRDPHTWARFLSSLDLRRRDLRAFARSAEALEAVGLEQARRALQQVLAGASPAQITVLPIGAGVDR